MNTESVHVELRSDHPAVREYQRRQQTVVVDSPFGPQIIRPPIGSWTYLDLAALNEILAACGYTVDKGTDEALFTVRRLS